MATERTREKIVGIRVTAEEADMLDRVAEVEERSKGDVVRRLIRDAYEKLPAAPTSKTPRRKKKV